MNLNKRLILIQLQVLGISFMLQGIVLLLICATGSVGGIIGFILAVGGLISSCMTSLLYIFADILIPFDKKENIEDKDTAD